ncbi:MAG: GatB/YqeY domain-containing protein [Nitrospirae bacterium]|nr:GatB/YqeY domain-containing protein [Candidatus Troglogloeales bacterium]
MEMQTRLLTEMKEAMKSGDGDRVSVIRLLRSAIKNKEIEKRPGIVKGQEQSLTEAEVLQVIASAVKQRKESIEMFLKENRNDLVDKEKKELAILESYLPKALSEEELNQIIKDAILKSGATTMKQMGDVMKLLMPKIMGKADGKQVSEMVRASLAH